MVAGSDQPRPELYSTGAAPLPEIPEIAMQMPATNSTDRARLRLVFSGAVKLFDLRPQATLADIARKLRDPSLRALGKPLAVDIAWTH